MINQLTTLTVATVVWRVPLFLRVCVNLPWLQAVRLIGSMLISITCLNALPRPLRYMPLLTDIPAGQVDLIACPECDQMLRDVEPPGAGGWVICSRCKAPLYRAGPKNLERALALVVTAIILLLVANLFPVIGMEFQGMITQTTILGAAWQLWQMEMQFVAVLIVLTIVLVPVLEALAIGWLVVHLWAGKRPPAFIAISRGLQLVEPWAMLEVFLLGILVALVKLSHSAEILPGPAIGAVAALMFVFAALTTTLDPRALWRSWEAAR
jgi:paraquat-inducible protein A